MESTILPSPIGLKEVTNAETQKTHKTLTLIAARVFHVGEKKTGVSSSTGRPWSLRNINVAVVLGVREDGREEVANFSLTCSGEWADAFDGDNYVGRNITADVSVSINSHFNTPHTEFRVTAWRLD